MRPPMRTNDVYELQPGEEIASELLVRIGAELELFAAVLASVTPDASGEIARFVGSGTLVKANGSGYVLTAGHVWTAIDKSARVAIHLGRNDIGVSFKKDLISPTVLGSEPFDRQPWGPDLALLRLPDHVRQQLELRGLKAFYDLDRHRETLSTDRTLPCHGAWVVVGCPAFASLVTEGAPLNLSGYALFGFGATHHEEGEFDYVDLRVNPPPDEGVPDSLKGMSGAGLWWTPLTKNAQSGQITWDGTRQLEGVAFREEFSPRRSIRCHWRRSVYALASDAVAGK